MTAGLHASQKNEYNITVLRGPSISEMLLSDEQIDFTGIDMPDVVLALSQEGVDRRKSLLARLVKKTLVLKAPGVDLPPSEAEEYFLDFKSQGIKPQDWALAALATMATHNRVISTDMLRDALATRFTGDILASVQSLVSQITVE